MKWPDALLKPTREYGGGILAGLGLGILLSEMIARRAAGEIPWIVAYGVGFGLVVVGSGLARAAQRQNKQNNDESG